MDFREELDKTIAKQKETLTQINKLDGVRQGLLQEALRLEGEVRVLNKLLALAGQTGENPV